MKAAVIQCPYLPRKKKISLKVSFDVSVNYLSDRIYLGFSPNRITINSIIVVIIAISIIIITSIVIKSQCQHESNKQRQVTRICFPSYFYIL